VKGRVRDETEVENTGQLMSTCGAGRTIEESVRQKALKVNFIKNGKGKKVRIAIKRKKDNNRGRIQKALMDKLRGKEIGTTIKKSRRTEGGNQKGRVSMKRS